MNILAHVTFFEASSFLAVFLLGSLAGAAVASAAARRRSVRRTEL